MRGRNAFLEALRAVYDHAVSPPITEDSHAPHPFGASVWWLRKLKATGYRRIQVL